MQGIHQLAARRAGGGLTVPVLVTPRGPIGESAQILEWVDERTEPARRLFAEDGAGRDRDRSPCAGASTSCSARPGGG